MRFYKALTIIAFFLFTLFAYPNDKNKNEKENTSVDKSDAEKNNDLDGDRLPENKYELNEELEELKLRLEKLLKTDVAYNSFGDYLQNYKSKVEAVSPEVVKGMIDAMQGFKDKGKSEEYKSTQEKLLNTFYDLREYNVYSDDDTENIEFTKLQRTFLSKINNFRNTIFSIARLSSEFNFLPADKKNIYSNFDSYKKLTSEYCSGCQSFKSDLDAEINSLNLKKQNLFDEIKKLKVKKIKILDKLDQQETQINGLSIKLGLPLFCGTILMLFLGPKIISCRKTNESDEEENERSKSVLVEICTVLLLTMSILILGLSDKIKGEVLGTLIGGISGYVLNKVRNAI